MNLLAIDTSTPNFSLAVVKDGRVVKYRNARLKRPLSSSIIPGIERVLNSAGLTLPALDGFAVGLGPGSFTSLRVGLSTVKGLAFTLKKPVIGISSLDILAMNVDADNVRICVLADAKRDMVYAGIYDKRGGRLQRAGDYHLDHVDRVLKTLKGKVIFVGDGANLYRKNIMACKTIKPEFAGDRHLYPQAKNLAAYALANNFQSAKQADNIVPMYLYPEHCQVQNHAKKTV